MPRAKRAKKPEIPLVKPPTPTLPVNSPALGKIRLIVSGPANVKSSDPRIVVERR